MRRYQKNDRISATVGEIFEIDLEEPASTGYAWEPIFDDRHLALEDVRSAVCMAWPGAAGRAVFRFRVKMPASAYLTFWLLAPWTPEPADKTSFEVVARSTD